MFLCVAQVERVHDHADIGGILAGHAGMGNLDQFEGGFVHGPLEFLVPVPVAIGLLDHDTAFQQQPFQHQLHVEFRNLRVAHTQRHILEIAEQGHGVFAVTCRHNDLSMRGAA